MVKIKIHKNKKGWLRIVECFVTIILVVAVVLAVVSRLQKNETGLEEQIYDREQILLRGLELNDTIREEVLGLSVGEDGISSDQAGFPEDIRARINSETPNYLECKVKICNLDKCILESYPAKSSYAKTVLITVMTTSASFNPRQLKIFCWII
jgi:hypothetical protein